MTTNYNPETKVKDLTLAELRTIILEIVESVLNNKNVKGNSLKDNYIDLVKEAVENYEPKKNETIKIIYWQQDDMWLGYLEEYPDYMTQGKTFEEFEENLLDIYKDLSGNLIPNARKVGHLKVA